ncbi:hypothetical protein B7R22_17030 [Subtercola boreus]|uniref:Uncharacterized protein n=1 Tax=Subtercola boreus TaxID=120213 RepID=A0A3E0VQ57_9MICO|nr:hypothetical protein [Subtercola boreus]RFA12134.1 hypothetical protein B7R22_17030 [Subtercola boreus]
MKRAEAAQWCADLDQIRQLLAEREEWNAIKFEAYMARCRADMFSTVAEGLDWLRALPTDVPSRGNQAAWAIKEARRTGVVLERSPVREKPARARKPAMFFTARQLEIAIHALSVTKARSESFEAAS